MFYWSDQFTIFIIINQIQYKIFTKKNGNEFKIINDII